MIGIFGRRGMTVTFRGIFPAAMLGIKDCIPA